MIIDSYLGERTSKSGFKLMGIIELKTQFNE